MSRLEALAKRIERLQTPDKLRLAAKILEETNDVEMALAVISQVVEHLMFVKAVESASSQRGPHERKTSDASCANRHEGLFVDLPSRDETRD